MNILISFIAIIVLSLCIALFSTYIFRKNAWVIILIEVPMILFLTLKDIIERYPTGNIENQLKSYFLNPVNNFYLRYIPFLICTIIFVIYFKEKLNARN